MEFFEQIENALEELTSLPSCALLTDSELELITSKLDLKDPDELSDNLNKEVIIITNDNYLIKGFASGLDWSCDGEFLTVTEEETKVFGIDVFTSDMIGWDFAESLENAKHNS